MGNLEGMVPLGVWVQQAWAGPMQDELARPQGLPLWPGEQPEHIPGQVLLVPWGKILPGRSYGMLGCRGVQVNQSRPL